MADKEVEVYFTMQFNVLKDAIGLFGENLIELKTIDPRQSQDCTEFMDFMVRVHKTDGLNDAIEKLRTQAKNLKVVHTEWFPKHVSELDQISMDILKPKTPKADDPICKDKAYKDRRQYFAEIAEKYKHGQPIPRANYTTEEINTWSTILNNVESMYPTYACKEFNELFQLLKEKCGLRPDAIPEMQEVSSFLRNRTGFTLRPVPGLLKIRGFLNGLAFRVFHATQHIRHTSQIEHTSEPDFCHELLGHVTMFADPDFAQFSQEIGLASLGASGSIIKKLTALYMFTVEFGLCKEEGDIKAYGASLLSSSGELKYCKTDQPTKREFDPLNAAEESFCKDKYQPLYYVADSFQSAKEKMRNFLSTIPRKFNVRYNPYTQTMEVLDNKESLVKFVKELHGEVEVLQDSLTKL